MYEVEKAGYVGIAVEIIVSLILFGYSFGVIAICA